MTISAFGPGRVNLVGEHTDYNDGLCLPFAVAYGVTVTVADGADGVVEAHALSFGEEDRFDAARPARAGGWRAFVRGVVAELGAAGRPIRGGRVSIAGDVPRGGGLSSSAALEVALALALLAHSGHPEPDRRELARLCSRVEHEWVGAQTGLMDQMAALFGRRGHAVRLDMETLELRHVPLDLEDWRLVTVHSGVDHAHAASGYNERRRECLEACRRLGVASLRDADPAAVERLPAPLGRRARHVLAENARVDAAVHALERRDLHELGRLLDASHASLRDDFEVSAPAVDAVRDGLKAGGAAGARIMGGGFGGSVLALLPPGAPEPAGALRVSPGPAARLLDGRDRRRPPAPTGGRGILPR